jgi:hypothetical protein
VAVACWLPLHIGQRYGVKTTCCLNHSTSPCRKNGDTAGATITHSRIPTHTHTLSTHTHTQPSPFDCSTTCTLLDNAGQQCPQPVEWSHKRAPQLQHHPEVPKHNTCERE